MGKRIKINIIVSGKIAEEAFKVDEQDLRTYLEEEFGYKGDDLSIEISEEEDKL